MRDNIDTPASCSTPAPRKRKATMHKPVPISSETRWNDAKGRAWRVIENLHFGRYLCVLVDRPAYSGEWTARDIRAALAPAAGVTP